MDQPYISPRYRDETPSAQTALDIFRGTWKSALPLEFKLETGSAEILIWASGVLYHSEDPIDLLSLVTSRTDKLSDALHYSRVSKVRPRYFVSGRWYNQEVLWRRRRHKPWPRNGHSRDLSCPDGSRCRNPELVPVV